MCQATTPLTPLLTRSSTGRLIDPPPQGDTLREILATSLRAPDHGGLKPWHHILVSGEQRKAFVDSMINSLKRRRDDLDEQKCQRRRNYYNTIPLFIVLGMKLQTNAPIPLHEQYMSVAAGAMNILNGLHMKGYGGMWVSGPFCQDPIFLRELLVPEITSLAGIIFAGSVTQRTKDVQRPALEEHVTLWRPKGG